MTAFREILRQPQRSLGARLVASFLALSLITLVTAATVAYRSARQGLAQAVFDHLTATASLKQIELNRWVDAQGRVLELMAGQPGIRAAAGAIPADTSTLREAAELSARGHDNFQEVFFLTGAGGQVMASTDPRRIDDFHTPDLFFLAGRAGPFTQTVYASPRTGGPTLTVSVPVRDDRGEVTAVLAAHLNLARIERIMGAAAGVHESMASYLVTENHEVLSALAFGLPEYLRGVHSDGIASALAGEAGVGLYESYTGEPVIGSYRWVESQKLGLIVEVAQEEAFAPARALLRQILISGAAATLLLMVGVHLIAVRVVRPITAVADAAALVAEGDFTVQAPADSDDELGDLARSFNSMTGRLNDLYRDLQNQNEVTSTTLSALEVSRSLLRSIVDNSNALIAVTDSESRVMIANRRLRELAGTEEAEYIGEPLSRFLPKEVAAEWIEGAASALSQRSATEREIRWPLEDETRTYLCTWFPLSDDGSERGGLGIIATDLTDRRRIEEERRRIETQFRHAQKMESLGVLAGGIAHDFNNILAAIQGHADLASITLDEDVDESKEHLQQVVSAARRAADLTNQMLAYAGKASFRVETLDLNQSIREMSNLILVSLPKKVSLESALSPDPLPIRGDPTQISQVVMNLVTNGAQAIGDDAGSVSVSTAASISADGSAKAVLRIRDDGCGMDAETLERIFDPFFSTKDGSRGLGLAAVLGIMTSLDGTLDVESEAGRGTTFRLTFPLDVGDDSDEHVAAPVVAEGPSEGTVLVVDDENAVRSFARRALERSGFTVLEARDGLEALDVFRRESSRVDAVVLDMSMPGMGGREVFEVLRQANGRLPVLFTSGYDPSDAAGTLLSAPHVRFLQKPYRPMTLGEEIDHLLRESA